MKKGLYVKIPSSLISATSMDEKRVLVYSAAMFSRWDNSRSISSLAKFCGFTPVYVPGKINSKIEAVYSSLLEAGYITNEFGQISEDRFGFIYLDEYKKILAYKQEGSSNHWRKHWRTLTILAYIRQRILKGISGVPEHYCCMYKKISEETGIDTRSIHDHLNVLKSLGILYYEEIPSWTDSCGEWHSGLKLFVDCSSKSYMNTFNSAKQYILKSSSLQSCYASSDPVCFNQNNSVYGFGGIIKSGY